MATRSSTKVAVQRIIVWPSTPLGPLWAEVNGQGAIVSTRWGKAPKNAKLVKGTVAEKQIAAYFKKARELIGVEIAPAGTAFQQKIWQAVRQIPMGTVMSYGELAHEHQTGPRAVARAMASCPISLTIPCHRVVASGGKVGGFGGGSTTQPGIKTKKWLLKHEGAM